jgi:hypothetical protein
LVRQLEEFGLAGWDIVVKARTATEDDELKEANEYDALGEDLASIDVDAAGHFATYFVSSKEIDRMVFGGRELWS